MAKMFNYMIITITVWIFLSVLGITISGSYMSSHLGMTSADSLSAIQNSSVWLALIAGFVVLAGISTVIIGTLTKSISAIPATAILASTVFVFIITDMILLIQQVPEPWMKNVLWLIVGPWTAGFIIAVWDWVRGID